VAVGRGAVTSESWRPAERWAMGDGMGQSAAGCGRGGGSKGRQGRRGTGGGGPEAAAGAVVMMGQERRGV
jgi:hypothetical protein